MKKNKYLYRLTSLMLALCLTFGGLTLTAHADDGLAEPYMKVAAAENCSFAVKVDHSLWAWGANWAGQLGDGTSDMRLVAVKIMDDVESVAAGGIHSLAVKTDGSLWAWGYNGHGAFGDGTTLGSKVPKLIMDEVVCAAAGGTSSYAIKTDGSLWAWGGNRSGQLGDGTTTNRLSPVHVMDDVASVIAGPDNAFAIKTDGSLWSWGDNYRGKVGDGTAENRSIPLKILENVVSVSSGSNFSIAVSADGALWAWGQTYQWLNGSKENYQTPTKIMDGAKSVACGDSFAQIVKTDGSLWACGQNGFAQLGDGTTTNRWIPVKVLEDVTTVACGSSHSIIVKTDGSLWGIGDDTYGQMGDGTGTNYVLPMMSLVDIDGVKRMAAGDGHAMALKEDGSLWIWGNNTQGQLGDGTSKDRSKPQKVLDNVVDMDGGSSHTLAVQADGSLWAWGYNTYGQVGNNSTINCVTPVRVLDDVKKLACGSYHSLAIKSDNSLWAWGDNIQGQLGDGTKTNRRIPIKIMDDVADVAAGYLHTVVIKTDGSLWTWGYNYSGQLGDGTTVHREAPLKIIESGVASIAASANRTQALMTDGSLWVWGDNGYGQVGDGTTRGRLSPVKVMDGGVAYVTSGGLRTLVLKNDDSLWVCGAGPVGDGKENGAIRSSFIRIMDDVASVATAYHNTFVIKTDGSLWSWGGNHHGVLGYDETIPRKLMPEGSILPYTPKDPSVIESISTITITGLADPVAGGWPFGASDLYTPDNGYAVESVDWNPSVASSFDFGVAYSATITLAADSNYKFVEGVETSVNAGTPSQQGTVIGGDAPGNMFIFRVDFAATEQAKAPEILVPTASPDSGTSFTGELTISLYCATDGASIYYTVDGSDPADITGLLYNEAITLSDTTMLKAVACIDDAYSDIAMFAYTRDAVPDVLHESTPSASVDFTSECLTGLASNAAYSVNGAAKTADLNGNIAIEATWLGTAINIVKIGVASDNTSDSDPQTLALPARPAAPALGKVDTTGGSSNGKITGVDETMEYKAGGASTWTAIAGKELTGLPAGTYSVRFRATPSAFASALASVTIAGSTAPVEGGGGIGVGGGSGGSEVAIVKQEVPLADLLSFPAFIQGFEDNTFRGDSLITREQFVAILFRINNSEATLAADSSAPTFNDVAPSRWSFDAIEWAKEAGIIEADQNGSFRPADPLTRAEMADMFVKAEKLSEAAINAFSDIDGHLHADAILKAAKAGIFTGYTDGTFKPDGNTTRNEAVAALIRYLLGGEPVDAMWQNISVSFSDVLPSHWATKYVRLAVHGYEEMPR